MVKKTVREENAGVVIDVAAQEVAGVDPHRVESLTDLAAEGDRLEAPQADETGGAGGEGTAGPAAPPVDPENAPGVADMVNLMEFARDVSAPMLVDMGVFREGQMAGIWTADALKGIAVPLVQVCDRHGMGVGEALDRFGPYVALAAGVLFPTLATVKAIRENKAQAPDGQQREA